jgi:hypothetical protein
LETLEESGSWNIEYYLYFPLLEVQELLLICNECSADDIEALSSMLKRAAPFLLVLGIFQICYLGILDVLITANWNQADNHSY